MLPHEIMQKYRNLRTMAERFDRCCIARVWPWTMSWIALIAGLFTLFEALMSWCVLYQILGKSECPVKKKK
jgi:Protein of unknown function (DUF2892)